MPVCQLVKKELIILLRDRRTFVLLLAMPMVFIAILGMTTGHLITGLTSKELRLVVIDHDASRLSSRLIDTLGMDPRIDIEIGATVPEARQQVQRGLKTAAVVIGRDFSRRAAGVDLVDLLELPDRRLALGLSSLDIQVHTKSTLALTRALVAQLVFIRAAQVLASDLISRSPLIQSYIESHPEVAIPEKPRGDIAEVAPYFANLMVSSSTIYMTLVPSYTVMFSFFLITIMARSFISERQTGTILRLRSAPLSNAALAAGKTIPFFLVSFVQAILLLVAGRLLFDMSFGQLPWMLLPVIFCTALSVIGLGLLTGAAARTEAQVLSYGTFLIIVLAGISGCLMPRDWMPAAMQQLALTTPHAWALIAYDELLSGQPPDLARVWLSCFMLVIFATLFFTAGLVTLRVIRRRA